VNQVNLWEKLQTWGEVREISWISSEAKPTLDGGQHPSKCKWLNLSIHANLCLL